MRKKRLLCMLSFLYPALFVMAQYAGSGYYRIRNFATKRYMYVTDDTGNYDISRDVGDFGAIRLLKDETRFVSDPASIIYIEDLISGEYNYQSQGTSLNAILNNKCEMYQKKDGLYKGTYMFGFTSHGITKYLCDMEALTRPDEGALGTSRDSPYRNWELLPVSESNDNYFGITPTIQIGDKYYYPFYAAFPFTLASDGMKAYIISKVNLDKEVAVMREMNGVIPAQTPIIIECKSPNSTENRLSLTVSSANAPKNNILKGVFFSNIHRPKSENALTKFDSSSMRVLGKTADGKLGFIHSNEFLINADGMDYLPGNQSFLPVDKYIGNKELHIVTEDEYENSDYRYTITYYVDGEIYKVISLEAGKSIIPLDAPTREGYTFSGWSDIPQVMPEKDITVEGSFTANYYTITYMVNGEIYKEEDLKYGSTIIIPDAPYIEGYSFYEWIDIPETMPAKNIVINASYMVNSYSLIYMIDGEVYQTYTIKYGEPIVAINNPFRMGYTFSGWENLPATMPANDVLVNGMFIVNKYTLTYVVDDEIYERQTIEYGTEIDAPIPEKEGYTFSGWQDLPTYMPADDIIVNGSFSVNHYTLTYYVDGVNYLELSIEYGAPISIEPYPEKEGFTFSGWNDIPSTMPATNIVVEGHFVPNLYTLTYMVNDDVFLRVSIACGNVIMPIDAPNIEGYSFIKWTNLPEIMPANDLTIYASYTINSYTLIYLLDGEVYNTLTIQYGAEISEIDSPYKMGYTFSGWNGLPEIMPAKDVTVTGSFTINSYTLTYIIDGEKYKTTSVVFGSNINIEEVPEREGYTFSGWSEIPATMPAEDVTVTGTFTINQYRVTYEVDGNIITTELKDYGTNIIPPSMEEKEGYEFVWDEYPEIVPASDITVKGQYVPKTYILTYILDGEEYKTVEITYGTEIQTEKEPEREGYTFSGWDGQPVTMPAENVTVTGSFTINSYKLTYMLDGEVYRENEVVYGTDITSEAAPTKEGYTFSGWSEIPDTMPAHDVTITGSFTINSYKLTYMVDGKEYKSYTIEYGCSITPEDAPGKEGYSFSGWDGLPETMPAEDVTVTGTFAINSYTLTYLLDGEEYKTFTIEYGCDIVPEVISEKEGYTFTGWSEIPETMPAHDVTVTGSFAINTYKLTYMVDGTEYKSYDVEYAADITPEADPTKKGYSFSGWSYIPSTMPAEDVTVNGTFVANEYHLTYIVDGEIYKEYDVKCDATIKAENEPTKEGYTFSGWSYVPSKMPAENVTVTGTFTINQYTITYIIDGEVFYTESIDYGSEIVPPSVPERSGYDFAWEDYPETVPANDVIIYGSYTTGIARIMVDRNVEGIYSMDGKRLSSPQHGVNIIRMKDGTVKRVMVK